MKPSPKLSHKISLIDVSSENETTSPQVFWDSATQRIGGTLKTKNAGKRTIFNKNVNKKTKKKSLESPLERASIRHLLKNKQKIDLKENLKSKSGITDLFENVKTSLIMEKAFVPLKPQVDTLPVFNDEDVFNFDESDLDDILSTIPLPEDIASFSQPLMDTSLIFDKEFEKFLEFTDLDNLNEPSSKPQNIPTLNLIDSKETTTPSNHDPFIKLQYTKPEIEARKKAALEKLKSKSFPNTQNRNNFNM